MAAYIRLHSRSRSASGILLQSHNNSTFSPAPTHTVATHRQRHLQTNLESFADQEPMSQSQSAPTLSERANTDRNRMSFVSGSRDPSKYLPLGFMKRQKQLLKGDGGDFKDTEAQIPRSNRWSMQALQWFFNPTYLKTHIQASCGRLLVEQQRRIPSKHRWVKYPIALYCLFSMFFMTSAIYTQVVALCRPGDYLPAASWSNHSHQALPDEAHRVVSVQPPPLGFEANAYKLSPSTPLNINTGPGVVQLSPTACLWTTYTDRSTRDLLRWKKSWNGPISLLVVTTTLPNSQAHQDLLQQFQHIQQPQIVSTNVNDSLLPSSLWRILSLVNLYHRPQPTQAHQHPLYIHVLHVRSVAAASPNAYLNIARAFAQTSGEVVLFPAGLEVLPGFGADAVGSLTLDALPSIGTELVETQGQSPTFNISQARVTLFTSTSSFSPVNSSISHPIPLLNDQDHAPPLNLSTLLSQNSKTSPKESSVGTSATPILIPQNYHVWCNERAVFSPSPSWAWEDCVFEMVLGALGEVAVAQPQFEPSISGIDVVNADPVDGQKMRDGFGGVGVSVPAWQDKLLRRMRSNFGRETCYMAFKQFSAEQSENSGVRKRRDVWLRAFCREFAEYTSS